MLPVTPSRTACFPNGSIDARMLKSAGRARGKGDGGAVSAKPRRKLVTIDTVARGGANIGASFLAVLAGKLAPQAVDAKAQGYGACCFEPQWILETLGFTGQTMSVKEAADKLGVKQQVAYEWVRRGLLRTVAGTTKAEAGSRITPEALDYFRKEYVTGVELAATVGSRSRRHSSPQLMELGLTPVSGPSVDGARQYLFRRADAENRSLRPLRDFVQGKTPQPKRSEAWALARHVGRAAAGCLGLELRQTKNSFVDSAGTTVVQVVTGRRNGFRGAYRLSSSPARSGAWTRRKMDILRWDLSACRGSC